MTSQSVKDALADAETLENVARRMHSRRGWMHTQLYRAKANGWLISVFVGDSAAHYARLAARAAFRAVPALRGEE